MFTNVDAGTVIDPEADEAAYWVPVPPLIGVNTLHV